MCGLVTIHPVNIHFRPANQPVLLIPSACADHSFLSLLFPLFCSPLFCTQVVTAALFFVYIKLPGHFHRDALSLAVVIFVWTLGGYINTCANILAPSLVHPELVSRASALLALIFQVILSFFFQAVCRL